MERKTYQVPLELDCMSERQHLSTGIPRVSAILRFDSDRPYTIELTFYISQAVTEISSVDGPVVRNLNEITWSFSREILQGALIRASGSMDVKAWPEAVAGHAYVYFQFSDRRQQAVFRTGWWIIMQFMQEVDRMVPLHDASNYLGPNLDQALERLLSDGTDE